MFTFRFLVLLLMCSPALLVAEVQNGCVPCHTEITPGIVNQWKASKHSDSGIDCLDCHEAKKGEIDAFEHYGEFISVIVSPRDCAECHEKEVIEQKGSHHAKAGQILGSLDNLLGEVLGGPPAVNAGCRQCHGSEVRVNKDGRPSADTWPNTGMGRINPDGSKGSCSACHTRHTFLKAQARQPEACGKCHLGPDHPQIEVWEESKHGVLYRAGREKMNLEKDTWVAGKDYHSGPTCASCHMSAGGKSQVTHDVGERISWTLRPPVSTLLNMIVFEDYEKTDIPGYNPKLPEAGSTFSGKKVAKVLTWQDRRFNMREVCTQCHGKNYVESAYDQFDAVVHLYNDKFAIPARSIVDELKARKIISEPDFDDHIEWIWWELWHHEGRRGRHGAAMQGPDYTWWHGLYEVAKHFYDKFIPELKKIAGDELASELLEKHVYSIEGHQWHKEGLNPEAIERIRNFYQKRYKQ